MTNRFLSARGLVIVTAFFVVTINGMDALSAQTVPTEIIAQEAVPTEISQLLESYKKAALAQNAKGLVSLAYPPLFKVTAKGEVITRLEQMYQRKAVPTIKTMTFTSFGKPQSYSKGQFVMIDYSVRMELHRPGDATPQIDGLMTNMMVKNFGILQTKVSIDEKNSLVVVNRKSQIFAIKEGEQSWTLMDDDQFMSVLKKNILPGDLAKNIWEQRRYKIDMQPTTFCEARGYCIK